MFGCDANRRMMCRGARAGLNVMAGGRYNMVLHKHGDTLYQNVEELFRERSVALCEKARHEPTKNLRSPLKNPNPVQHYHF